MKRKRKIQKVGRTISFADAEAEDDKYWANATIEERLNQLMNLRMMVFGTDEKAFEMQKVVFKRNIYEEED